MSEHSKEELDKVIFRITQMRKIAASTHSRAESETMLSKAAQMLAQYSLTEAELLSQNDGTNVSGINVIQENIIYESGRTVLWKSTLAMGLAKLYGLLILSSPVRHPVSHRNITRYRVIGQDSDVKMALYLMETLLTEIKELAELYVPSGSTAKKGSNRERESWSLGCVKGFLEKMTAEQEVVFQQASSQALTLLGNKVQSATEAFEGYHGRKLGQPKKVYHKTHIDKETYESGLKKGHKLTITKEIDQ